MAETIVIDGRGATIQEAISEMWSRMRPLEAKGFHPISQVEIVDASTRKVTQSFQLTDPEFRAHLGSDGPNPGRGAQGQAAAKGDKAHAPESKSHYSFLARITLEL
ncbi:MAG: hypothetical protein ABSF83_11270 [Nitrososphaerales archaeon]